MVIDTRVIAELRNAAANCVVMIRRTSVLARLLEAGERLEKAIEEFDKTQERGDEMLKTRQDIYKEIDRLRVHQTTIGYDHTHDDQNTEDDWIELIRGYATEKSTPYFLTRMLGVASIAVAAIEAYRRQEKA